MSWTNERISHEEKSIRSALRGCGRIPRHVGIIMDGNGRWAEERMFPRVEGHRVGMESVRDVVKVASQLGIRFLTLYAFSIENWKRPVMEVRFLMSLLESYLRREVDDLHANNVCIRAIGKINSLPRGVQHMLRRAIDITEQNDGLTLTLALSYGSRWDILRSVQMLSLDVRRGKVSPEDITEETFSNYLQTSFLPEPDLIIRTSGEMRLSNFLMWESAYAEIYVTQRLWPEFRRMDFYRALADFARRERRFGCTSSQIGEQESEHVSHLSTLEHIFNALH